MSNFKLRFYFSSLVSLFKLSRTLSFHGFRVVFFLKKYKAKPSSKRIFLGDYFIDYTNKRVGFSYSV